MEISTNSHAARPAYLMRDRKAWREVHKGLAVAAMKRTRPDTIAVLPVWVYSPTISHRAAAELVKRTAPDSISSLLEDAAIIEFKENCARNTAKCGDNAQTESAGLAPWEEETAEYNDAGVLETPNERQEREQNERKTKEQQGIRIARERAAAEGREFIPPTPRREAPKPAPRFYEYVHAWERTTAPAPAPVTRELPAAPYYHATEEKIQKANRAAWETLSDERAAYQQRRARRRRERTARACRTWVTAFTSTTGQRLSRMQARARPCSSTLVRASTARMLFSSPGSCYQSLQQGSGRRMFGAF